MIYFDIHKTRDGVCMIFERSVNDRKPVGLYLWTDSISAYRRCLHEKASRVYFVDRFHLSLETMLASDSKDLAITRSWWGLACGHISSQPEYHRPSALHAAEEDKTAIPHCLLL